MECPNCQQEMKKQDSLFGHWLEDYVFLEIIFWLFLMPLTYLGLLGFLIIGVIIFIVKINHGKTYYICRTCCYTQRCNTDSRSNPP
jgi:hypothetical protein